MQGKRGRAHSPLEFAPSLARLLTRASLAVLVCALSLAGAGAAPAEPPEATPEDARALTTIGSAPAAAETQDEAAPGGQWQAQGPGPTTGGQVENIQPAGSNNPVSGGIEAIATHPTDPNTVYLAAINGGIWRTTNATSNTPTWTPLTDRFPSLSFGELEMDPTDAGNQTLVGCIGRFSSFGDGGPQTGILRTTDGGNTWTALGQADLTGRNISAVAPRGNIILVAVSGGTGPGIYRSTNGGATFQLISGTNGLNTGAAFDLARDPSNNQRIYAAVGGANGGIFRTDDAGANWTDVTDAGIAAVVGGGTNNMKVSVSAAAGNAVFAAIVNGGALAGVFRTPDQGATWAAMDLPQTNEAGQPMGIHPGGQGRIHFSLLADSTNGNLVYIGGDRQGGPFPNSIGASDFSGRLFRGDAAVAPTGGVPSPQWTPLTHSGTANNSSPHADSRDMAFDANGNLLEGDDGGIFRRTNPRDATGDWFMMHGNIQPTEFHAIAYDSNSNIIIGGTQDTGTPEQTSSGSTNWRSVSTADGGVPAVDDTSVAGQSTRFSSNQRLGGFRRRTCDAANSCGAATFIGLNPGGDPAITAQFYTPIELNVTDQTRILLGGANGVYESADQGDNISRIAGGAGGANGFVYGHANNPELIYVAAPGGVQVRTLAGGNLAATAAAFPGGGAQDLAVDPTDENALYVITTSGVFSTSDGGGAWSNITGNIAAGGAGNFQSVAFIEGTVNDVLAVGTNAGVMAAVEPHFNCWFRLGAGLPNAVVYDLDYDAADGVLVAGTLGRSAWTLRNLSALTVPVLTIPGPVAFADTCVGETSLATLNICNTGKTDLRIDSITSSDPQFSVTAPSSGFPVVISPDFCFPFQVRFSPSSEGPQAASLTITSNDPCQSPFAVDATGNGAVPRIVTGIANSGNFGDVCVDAFKDKSVVVSNSGGCDLVVTLITSSSPDFVVPSVVTFPIVVAPGTNVKIPIRFAPTSLGAKAGTITIHSNDPVTASANVAVSGNAPPGDVRVTGSTDFGDVCAGVLAEKTVSVCNVGKCDLHVLSVALNAGCLDFTLINNPFPAAVSPDSCQSVVVRFTPVSVGPKGCSLFVVTDDPDTPIVERLVRANTPVPSIDVPPSLGFPPTVIQSVGACNTPLPFPVSNTGTCNLTITQFGITNNPAEYLLSGLPSFPIILEPGHIAGEGNLATVFEPDNLSRADAGQLTVTYLSDPILGTTTSVTRDLCGEGVRTGARVLVTAGGIPLASVEQIKLTRINANRNKNLLDTVDTARNLLLQTVTPGSPCAPFQYHREYGTVSNQIQLLPGSYQVTVTAIVNGRRMKKSVGFDVNTCGFNPAITVNF